MKNEAFLDHHEVSLRKRWEEHRAAMPKARIFDIAAAMKVSELELVAAHCGCESVRLRPEFGEILKSVARLGTVMALTRNQFAVIEKTGVYDKVEIMGKMGLVLNSGIDLRLFFAKWCYAYGVTSRKGDSLMRSLQFFDASGTAIHKVFLRDNSKDLEYRELIKDFSDSAYPSPHAIYLSPRSVELRVKQAPSSLDRERLHADWRALKDTHDFIKLLKGHKVEREQALVHVADPDLARPVAPSALRQCLELARDQRCSIMVFVGNDGAIEIHTGLIQNVKVLGPWLNILDDDFNLHLREDLLARAWVVRKPTVDGIVSSLELFAEDGFLIGQVFGERKPGKAELGEWRAILETLPQSS
jgi:putative hemin transport protein